MPDIVSGPPRLTLQGRARGNRRGPEVGAAHGHVLLEHPGNGDRRRQRQARGTDRLPWSVSSLAQRLGRSGRKEGEPSVIRIYVEEDEPEQNASLFYRLFLDLLKATAMTKLMLEKWCEPPDVDFLHLSTLVQQVLSVIKERGGARADALYHSLVVKGGFPGVDQATMLQVLRSMGTADLIEQTPEGLLITGLRGEEIVKHHDFYIAFIVHDEYRVNHAGHHVGNIDFVPEFEEEGFLILAGRRWRILDIDHDRKTIIVEPSPGGRVPSFPLDRWPGYSPPRPPGDEGPSGTG